MVIVVTTLALKIKDDPEPPEEEYIPVVQVLEGNNSSNNEAEVAADEQHVQFNDVKKKHSKKNKKR